MSRYPAVVLALSWCIALAVTVVVAPHHPVLGVVALAAAIPVAAGALVVRPAIVALALACALLAVARGELPPADLHAAQRAGLLVGQVVTLSGRVIDDSRPSGGGAEVLVEPTQVVLGPNQVSDIGNLLVRWRGPTVATFGEVLDATGKVTLPRDLPSFDRRAYLAQRDVYVEVQASNVNVGAGDAGLAVFPSWLRSHYVAAVSRAIDPPHSAMLVGIVLGVREGIPPSLQNALIATGLIHLLVLSGLKVAVFARLVQGALRPFLHRHASWPAVALIGLYAFAGGATPAAVRASAMGGLAILAGHLGRPTHVWTSLALTAAAMLGWHPELAWDVGYQLSLAGTAAIILLTPAFTSRLSFMPHVVREPFAVTCAAQIGTLPMTAIDFHVLSPIAPIANALTLPVLPALVGAGLLLACLPPVADVSRLAGIPIAGLLAYVEGVGYALARVPMASIPITTFPGWLGMAYYSALGPAIAAARTTGVQRTVAATAAVLAPAAIAATSLVIWAASPPEAIVMNVGDGQAVLLRGPGGSVLIDGGPSPAKLADGLGSALPPWQRSLDALVITAPGLGHTGGLASFDRRVGTVFVPDAGLTGTAWRTAALDAVARGASIALLRAGEVVDEAGFRIEVLAPELGAPGEEPGAADLAVRVVAPDGRSFCDLSDLDQDAQTVAAARFRGRCSYVLLPGGGRSLLSPDLEAAALTVSSQLIASRGQGRLAAGYPPDVLRTDQEGTITVPL